VVFSSTKGVSRVRFSDLGFPVPVPVPAFFAILDGRRSDNLLTCSYRNLSKIRFSTGFNSRGLRQPSIVSWQKSDAPQPQMHAFKMGL
jgi:hypothetical protein